MQVRSFLNRMGPAYKSKYRNETNRSSKYFSCSNLPAHVQEDIVHVVTLTGAPHAPFTELAEDGPIDPKVAHFSHAFAATTKGGPSQDKGHPGSSLPSLISSSLSSLINQPQCTQQGTQYMLQLTYRSPVSRSHK